MLLNETRKFRIRASLAAIVLVVSGGCARTQARGSEDGSTAAGYAAGLVRREYVDSARMNWRGAGNRPVITLIFYPTTTTGPAETLGLGPPADPLFVAGVVTPGASLSDAFERYPLIVLSHGTGGSAVQLGWLGVRLARHGFIAAAINHHGNTGAEGNYDARGFMLWWERSRDIRVALDRLLADPMFAHRIDTGAIGAAGFSLGGYTVLSVAGGRTDVAAYDAFCASAERDFTCEPQPEMPTAHEEFARVRAVDPVVQASIDASADSYRDERVRAVVAIAPALGRAFAPPSLTRVEIPVMIVSGGADTIAPPATNAELLHGLMPRSRILRLPAARHYSFLAACTARALEILPDLCAEPPGVDRSELHDLVADSIAAFFRRELRRQPGRR